MADMSPKPMADRFRGGSSLDKAKISTKRTWDTGTAAAQGAPFGQNKGNASQIRSAAKFNNSNSGMKPIGGLGNQASGIDVGKSITAGQQMGGNKSGMGPKVTGGKTPPPIQKGRTTGPYKGPAKGTKTGAGRFQSGGIKGSV